MSIIYKIISVFKKIAQYFITNLIINNYVQIIVENYHQRIISVIKKKNHKFQIVIYYIIYNAIVQNQKKHF